MVVRRSLLFGGLLYGMAALGSTAAAQDCDAECVSELREKIIRDLRSLNNGEFWA